MQKKVKINGTPWTMKLVTADEIAEINDGGPCTGLCICMEKTIYFDKDDFTANTVKHELFHAYVCDLHLDDTNDISLKDLEEIFAGMFSDKAETIVRQARRLYKQLKALMENNDEN